MTRKGTMEVGIGKTVNEVLSEIRGARRDIPELAVTYKFLIDLAYRYDYIDRMCRRIPGTDGLTMASLTP